jgi:hypothetical protein
MSTLPMGLDDVPDPHDESECWETSSIQISTASSNPRSISRSRRSNSKEWNVSGYATTPPSFNPFPTLSPFPSTLPCVLTTHDPSQFALSIHSSTPPPASCETTTLPFAVPTTFPSVLTAHNLSQIALSPTTKQTIHSPSTLIEKNALNTDSTAY